jgi:glycosyltransferase involved in cell wall biosynthesis
MNHSDTSINSQPSELASSGLASSELLSSKRPPSNGQGEQFLASAEDLKLKVDALRVENQALHSKIAELQRQATHFSRVRYLLAATVISIGTTVQSQLQQISKTARQSLKMRLKQLIRWISRGKAFAIEGSDNLSDKNFSPYRIRIIHPIQSDRPRVLHIIGNFYTGGSSQLVVDLIEHLGHRYEQMVVARDLPGKPSYLGIDIHHHEILNDPSQALAILESLKPDFIHMHYLGDHNDEYSELDWKWYDQFFQAVETYGCKVIENINIPTDPYVSDAVSAYVYVSDYVRHQFSHAHARNVTVYPGSNLSVFSREPSQKHRQESADCIGMVYRLEGDKLNEQAIDVFIKAVQLRPHTKALIVGGGYFLESYQHKVAQAGLSDAFTFTGYIAYEALPALYAQMSLFIAPVHTESFGQVTPFAMAMKLPVVGYDVGAIAEIVGDRTLLAPPKDVDSLADIVVALLNDPQRRLDIGAANLHRAQQKFSVESMIDSYQTLYEELASQLKGASHA